MFRAGIESLDPAKRPSFGELVDEFQNSQDEESWINSEQKELIKVKKALQARKAELSSDSE